MKLFYIIDKRKNAQKRGITLRRNGRSDEKQNKN